jgi:NAD(P)-dependent dehydrogenase (short-subunit alcohol dehydrogenase family)
LSNAEAKNIELNGKAVLVTGASSGIGRSIAETLASNGAFVYAGARKQKDIDELSQIKNIVGIRLDVTKENEIVAAVELVKKEGRGLYGLVNNAGVFFHAPLIEVADSEMQFMMNVNVFGPYRVTKAFSPLIIESKGRISNISSIAGIAAGPMFGPYAMSKFALEAFSESLSHEMRKFDVQVSVVEPGNFKSNIMKNMHKRLALMEADDIPTSYKEEHKALGSFTAIDRSHHRDPVAVANAVVQALSSDQPKLRYLVAPTQAEANMMI